MSEQDTSAAWLVPYLGRAGDRFGVQLLGPPVPGWRGCSLGSRATAAEGDRWVRVVSEQVDWTTVHRDLHWANLLQPDLVIVDWEGWGPAPAGYDAATLHAYTAIHEEG